jgi:hypothetical protein
MLLPAEQWFNALGRVDSIGDGPRHLAHFFPSDSGAITMMTVALG